MRNRHEAKLRSKLVEGLREIDAFAVENSVALGTPDINYFNGWIECKYIANFPKKYESSMKIHHFTNHQRLFLKKRYTHNQSAYLFLQVDKFYFLIDGVTAANMQDFSYKNLIVQSLLFSRNRIHFKKLIPVLTETKDKT